MLPKCIINCFPSNLWTNFLPECIPKSSRTHRKITHNLILRPIVVNAFYSVYFSTLPSQLFSAWNSFVLWQLSSVIDTGSPTVLTGLWAQDKIKLSTLSLCVSPSIPHWRQVHTLNCKALQLKCVKLSARLWPTLSFLLSKWFHHPKLEPVASRFALRIAPLSSSEILLLQVWSPWN